MIVDERTVMAERLRTKVDNFAHSGTSPFRAMSSATHLGTHLARAIRGAKRTHFERRSGSLGTQKRNAIRGDDGTEKTQRNSGDDLGDDSGDAKTQRNSGDDWATISGTQKRNASRATIWGTQKRNAIRATIRATFWGRKKTQCNSGGESEMHENPGGDEF